MEDDNDLLLLLLLDGVDLAAPLAKELKLTTRGEGRGSDIVDVVVVVFAGTSVVGCEGSSCGFLDDMSELTLNIDRLGSICSFNCSCSTSEILFSSCKKMVRLSGLTLTS